MAEPAVRPERMTFEQAAELDPDQQPGELLDGEWIPVTRNTWRHGEVVFNVSLVLGRFVKAHPGWRVAVGDPGARLARDPDRLRGPDVGVIREDRKPVGRGAEGWLDGAPNVAVEVVGDDQSYSELSRKALEYLAAGAQAVWVLDAEPQRVVVFEAPDRVRVLTAEETLEGGAALPGFACKVAEFFD